MKIQNILKNYIPIADMIAESMGNLCEVVIHDLSTPQNSVYYVANGSITNRKIGQSFDHLIKNVLLSKKFNNDYTANYTFTTDEGKKIKSSTAFLYDTQRNIIGAFCINFDIQQFSNIKSFLDNFLVEESEPLQEESTPLDHVNDIIDHLIENIIGNKDVSKNKKKDNLKIITFMYEKGIFLIKGSVEKVADKLSVSPVTVYSYLDEVKKNATS